MTEAIEAFLMEKGIVGQVRARSIHGQQGEVSWWEVVPDNRNGERPRALFRREVTDPSIIIALQNAGINRACLEVFDIASQPPRALYYELAP